MAQLLMKPGILDKIREGRAIRSDKEMALLAGVSPETYSKFKNGERPPSARFLAALAYAFQMPLDSLAVAVDEEIKAAA